MATPLIEFIEVWKKFGDKTVLAGVDLTIYEGQVTTIIGKSGSGKSVMLKHIIGLLQPDSGRILFHGEDIGTGAGRKRPSGLNGISYMFQNNALFDSMTVYDNIAFPLRQTTDLSEKEIAAMVGERMAQIDLVEAADKYPAELSGGMQKRVALGRALVTSPKIILFDEPTTGQDIVRRNAILSMIAEYQRKIGFTAVIISHDLPDVLFISDRVLVLHEGKVVFQGTPEELDRFQHPFINEFIESFVDFQAQLTGLYATRGFKMRYQTALNKKNFHQEYALVVFNLANFADLQERLGFAASRELLAELGEAINVKLDMVGGFSARQKRSQFVTVLPFSTRVEAEAIVAAFGQSLVAEGLPSLTVGGGKEVELVVLAGSAQGRLGQDDINQVFRAVRSNQHEIARIRGSRRGEAQ